MPDKVYLDHNATTPIKPQVIDLVTKIMEESGNASSVHAYGRTARNHIEKAREQVAHMVGTQASSVTFNSGATEANNSVLSAFKNDIMFVSAIEHPSVLEAAPQAQRIPVTPQGVIDIDAFEKLLANQKPALVSVMLVNSETGVIQPVEQIARIAKKKYPDVHVHCDAVQAAGRIHINFPAMQIDYMSLSAHKLGGPQGVGALITAPGARSVKMLYGGGQEKQQRAGTENIAGITGFGLAAKLALQDFDEYQKLAELRSYMEAKLQSFCANIKIFGQDVERVSNTTCFSCSGISAQTQLMALDLDGIAVSSGSACSSGTVKTSHVLKAMNATPEELESAIRVSMGWNTAKEDIDAFLQSWSKMMTRINEQKNKAA